MNLQLCVSSLGKAIYCFNMTMCAQSSFIKKCFFSSLLWKYLTDLHRSLNSTPSSTFGMNWNTNCEPDLIIQHQGWTSLMLLWLKISAARFQKRKGKESLKPEEWRLLQQQINAHGFEMKCSTITWE